MPPGMWGHCRPSTVRQQCAPLLTLPQAHGAPPGGGDDADGFMPVFFVVVLPACCPLSVLSTKPSMCQGLMVLQSSEKAQGHWLPSLRHPASTPKGGQQLMSRMRG